MKKYIYIILCIGFIMAIVLYGVYSLKRNTYIDLNDGSVEETISIYGMVIHKEKKDTIISNTLRRYGLTFSDKKVIYDSQESILLPLGLVDYHFSHGYRFPIQNLEILIIRQDVPVSEKNALILVITLRDWIEKRHYYGYYYYRIEPNPSDDFIGYVEISNWNLSSKDIDNYLENKYPRIAEFVHSFLCEQKTAYPELDHEEKSEWYQRIDFEYRRKKSEN